MPKVNVVTRNGEKREIDGTEGQSIMQAIRGAGIEEIPALCGGNLSCATCHVYVDPTWLKKLPKATEDEWDLLDNSTHRQENSRLSCQINLSADLGGIVVTIPPED